MFDHPGRKIKNYVMAMFVIEAIFIVIAYLFALFNAINEDGDVFFVFFFGVLACAALLFFAYISMLFVYAFGELTEETTQQSELFRENNELLRQLLEQKKETPAPVPASTPEPKPGSKPKPGPLNQGQTRCPQCGTVQSDTREKCYQCGAPLGGE